MQVGETIIFGKFNWRVLDIGGGAALLIAEDITELRAYHNKSGAVTRKNMN